MFGIWGHPHAAELSYYGLHAQQHRGQEGAGVVVCNESGLKLHKGLGLVNDVFKHADFEALKGSAAISHIRYSKHGDKSQAVDSVEPLVFRTRKTSIAISHSGNIVNGQELRDKLEDSGSILQTRTDSELLAHLIKQCKQESNEASIVEALQQLEGAYTFLILDEKNMYVANDPHGIRPLSIGRLGEAYVVASETSAFDIVGATFEREVLPGELLVINDEGLRSIRFAMREQRRLCAMEYIYFSRPDSDLNQVNVHASRKRMGIELAKEAYVEADVVTGVPDSSISAAIGFAEQSGLPYEMGIIKNRYIGRTFIQPSAALREQGVKMKLSPVRGIVEGKRIVMIDDSIVRGTTVKHIVRLLKEAGAKEVHVRIASPAIENPCHYGIDMSTREELIAANKTANEIAEEIGADSVYYLSVDGMKQAIVRERSIHQGICHACMTGEYPVPVTEE
jgi:amidophosphoribosyltransferase